MPFENDKFDIVTAVETIYFWPNILENFKEVNRILKPEGNFVIICEMYSSEKLKERNDELVSASNINLYTPNELKGLLKNAGFNDITIDLVEEKTGYAVSVRNNANKNPARSGKLWKKVYLNLSLFPLSISAYSFGHDSK